MLRNERYTVIVIDNLGQQTDWFFDDYDDVIAMTMVEFGWAIHEDQLKVDPSGSLRYATLHHNDFEWFTILTSA